jgi:hypothetical protein
MPIEQFSILISITAITFLVVLILFIRFILVEKYFAPLKFTITNDYVIDPNLKKDFLKLTIYNSTLNDARITSFGYIYRQKNIDYFTEYLTQNNLSTNQQTIVPARDSMSFTLPLTALVDIVQDINGGGFRMKKIVAFATSSFGQTTRLNTRLIRKHLQKALDKRLRLERQRIAKIRQENRRIKMEKMRKDWRIFKEKVGFWFKKTLRRVQPTKKKQKP